MSTIAIAKSGAKGISNLFKKMPSDYNKLIIGAIVIGGAIWGGKKLLEYFKRQGALDDLNKDSRAGIATNLATKLYQAMKGWGTNELATMEVAQEMFINQITVAEVSAKYKSLFGQDLISTITKELSIKDFEKFNQIVKSGNLRGIPEKLLL